MKCTSGVTSLLPFLLLMENDGFEKQLLSLVEPLPEILGIPANVQEEFLKAKSRQVTFYLIMI